MRLCLFGFCFFFPSLFLTAMTLPAVAQASSRAQCYPTYSLNVHGAECAACQPHVRSDAGRRGFVLTWTDAETGDDPNNAADADVAHEGQVCL